MEEDVGTPGVKKSPRWRRFILIGGVVALLIVLAVASIPLLSPNGWSKDMVFDDGRMAMRVQFKTEPDVPVLGTQVLFAKVKGVTGFTMLVDHVHFTVTKDGETLVEALEAEPVGEFATAGVGFYRASVQLPSAGSYSVDLSVQHNQSQFNTTWSLEVR